MVPEAPGAGMVPEAPGASMAPATGPAPAPAVSPGDRRRVLAAAIMVTALASLDGNIVGPALPRIVSDLGGLAHLSWVVTAFSVASTAATPIYGWLSDRLGRKLAFAASITVFLLGSVLCGAAHGMGELIAARALQGVGAGGLITLAQTAIGDVLSPRERPKFQGWIASVFAISAVAGPLLGGAVTDLLSWPWIFYLNLPVGFAALAMILAGPAHIQRASRRRFDAAGFALVIFATCAFLLALSWGGTVYPWGSGTILSLLAASAVAVVALVFVERRAAEPALPPSLLTDRVIGPTILSLSLAVLGMFGSLVFVPLFFQLVHGASATEAGLRTAPIMGGLILASIFGGRAVARLGRTKPFILGGLVVSACSMAALAWCVDAGAGANAFDALLVVLGAGMGLVMPNMTTAIQNAAQGGQLGTAMATTSFFRSLGGAFGVALAGMMLTLTLRAHEAVGGGDVMQAGVGALQALPLAARAAVIGAYGSAMALIFAVFAVVLVVAALVTLVAPELVLRKTLAA
jgi:EmrB/QacA subfamily drug resistance transporter